MASLGPSVSLGLSKVHKHSKQHQRSNMLDLQPPTAYNSRDSHDFPSTHIAPAQFLIGASYTEGPLVNIPEIKGHLALLRMFAELRNNVAGLGLDSAPSIPVETEERWSWFVGLAVERCALFLQLARNYLISYHQKVRYLVPGLKIRGREKKF